MNYKQTAQKIVKLAGGKENILTATHCATRLRFVIKDEDLFDVKGLMALNEVVDVVIKAGQHQIIIGLEVPSLFNEVAPLVGDVKEELPQEKKGIFARIVDYIVASITPVLPVMMAGGLLKSFTVLAAVMGLITPESNAYIYFTFVGDAAYYFLPIFVAFNAAKLMKVNPMVAVMISASLLHPSFSALASDGATIFTLFGVLPIVLIPYGSTMIPTLLAVFLQKYVERFLYKISPAALTLFIVPLFTVVIISIVTFVVFGPLGLYIGFIVSKIIEIITGIYSPLATALVAGSWPLLVMTGMHYALVPVMIQNFLTLGYDNIFMPSVFAATFAMSGAIIAAGLKMKNRDNRSFAMVSGFTALLGITEPGMYGVAIKYKKPFIAAILGGTIGGFLAGLIGATTHNQGGLPSILTLAIFSDGTLNSLMLGVIISAVGFAAGFIIALVLPFKEDEANDVEVEIHAPLKGTHVPLSVVNDETFAKGIIGPGIAIVPSSNEIYAPFDGKVKMIFPTKHAIVFEDHNGVECLIHLGINTVELNGEHYKIDVEIEQEVKKGDVIGSVDFAAIKQKGYDITTPVLIISQKEIINITKKEEVDKNTIIFDVVRKDKNE